jgi:hypothetical protein
MIRHEASEDGQKTHVSEYDQLYCERSLHRSQNKLLIIIHIFNSAESIRFLEIIKI